MQSYATAKPSMGLSSSMGGLRIYDRERQLLECQVLVSVTRGIIECGLQSEISVSVTSV